MSRLARRRKAHQAVLQGAGDQGGAVLDVHQLHQLAEVVADGLLTVVQTLGDLLGREAVGREAQHLPVDDPQLLDPGGTRIGYGLASGGSSLGELVTQDRPNTH